MPGERQGRAIAAELAFFRDLGFQDVFVNVPAPPQLLPGSTGDLAAVARSMEGCTRCRLSESRTQIVFGYGNPSADLLFVGEAPGREEDEQGRPFVGAAGQLLTRIIEAMGTTREQVYVVNTVGCRPPENRDPEPGEVAACRPFLLEQIRLVAPRVIVTLRGRWQSAHGARVMPTYHPAYVLRSPKRGRKDIWADMQLVRDYLAGAGG
jgi:DNA polymerase